MAASKRVTSNHFKKKTSALKLPSQLQFLLFQL